MRYIVTYLLLLVSLIASAQHTPLVSQYMLNGLVINPAYTGSREVFTAHAMYRNQWVGFEGAPVNQVVSAHTPLKNKSLAVGLLFNNEKIGVSNNTALAATVAYRIFMENATLSFGLSAGAQLLSANLTELTTATSNDLMFNSNLRSNLQPDFGVGVFYKAENYFLGISIPTLIGRNYDITDEQLRITANAGIHSILLHGGYLFEINEAFKLKPSTLFRINPNGSGQIDINTNLIYQDRFWLGLSYRHQEAMVALFEMQINEQFKVGYAYDYALSVFRRHTSGSHEISLQYEFGFKVKSVDPRFF